MFPFSSCEPCYECGDCGRVFAKNFLVRRENVIFSDVYERVSAMNTATSAAVRYVSEDGEEELDILNEYN